MQPHISKHHQQGATLIVAMVFLVVLTAAGVTAMRFASVEERMASNSQFRNQSFQLAQSEIRAHLLAFNQNQAGLAPLQLSMDMPLTAPGSLPSSLPAGTRDPVLLAARMGNNISAPDNSVRQVSESVCDDGSSVTTFTCIKFEMNILANSASGADSWQTQGLLVQNNK